MTAVEQYRFLYDYHFDTLRRLLEDAQVLDEDAYQADPGYGRGSVHDLLLHILATDRSWRETLLTGQRPEPLDPERFGDVGRLMGLLAEEREAWEKVFDDLSDGQVGEPVELIGGPGRVMKVPRWWVLQHVVFHGMQHSAEIAQHLTERGQSPGDIDFIFYAFNRPSG